MKALPGLREEKRVGILQCQSTRGIRSRHNVAIAKLRQNHLEGLPKTIKNTMVCFSGTMDAVGGAQCAASSRMKEKLRLRIFGMNQEGCAAVDVAAQQTKTFVGPVPDFTTM